MTTRSIEHIPTNTRKVTLEWPAFPKKLTSVLRGLKDKEFLSPLRIAEISVGPTDGRLGLTLCPGKKDSYQGWDRDLATDLGAIREWGATTVMTLIEEHEFRLLAIETSAEEVRRFGMEWLYLLIRDLDIPDERFEQAWRVSGPVIHERLDAGQRILIHCRGGLGRTGVVAALILVERGTESLSEILCVRHTMLFERKRYAKQDEQEETGGSAADHPERAA